MLPTVGADTLKIAWYASEVAGRISGIAAMVHLVPDPQRRASLSNATDAIVASGKG